MPPATCWRPCTWAAAGRTGSSPSRWAPAFAHDTQASIAEAQRLFAAVDRPNVMVKIPGTAEGVPAILASMRDGLNINVTLLFTVGQYEAVADAYLDALEYRLRGTSPSAPCRPWRASSCRAWTRSWTRSCDQRIEAAADEAERRRLRGAQGQGGHRQRQGGVRALPQLPRAAAAGSSSPPRAPRCSGCCGRARASRTRRIPDLLYADELIGGHTVVTMPDETLEGVRRSRHAGAHGRPPPRGGAPHAARAGAPGRRHGARRRPAAGRGCGTVLRRVGTGRRPRSRPGAARRSGEEAPS